MESNHGGPGAGFGQTSPSRLPDLVDLAARLTKAVTVCDVAQSIAQAGVAEFAADSVTVYLLDDTGERAVLAAGEGMDAALRRRFARVDVDDPLPVGEALRSGEMVAYQTIAERNARYPQFASHPGGSGTVLVAPMIAGDGKRIGVISIGWLAEGRATAETRDFAAAVADMCGQAVRRAKQYDLQVQAHLAQRFLSDATALMNESLDLTETLQSLAQLAVPDVVDVCAVCLTDDDGDLRPLAAATADPDRQEILDKLVARQPVIRSPRLLEVATTGRSYLTTAPDPEEDEREAEDAEHLSLIRALDASSGVIVPLRTQDRILGLVVLLMAGDRRPLGRADVALAEALAERAATAIDNARVHTELDSRAEHLAHALDSRIVIEQAKGLLAERWDVDPLTAFERMRSVARSRRLGVHAFAAAVLEGTADITLED